MATQEAVFQTEIPPQPQRSRSAREAVAKFARARHVDDDTLEPVLTALGEALANAIEHAHSAKPIAIEVRIDAERILAVVRDHGVGFATEGLTQPCLPDVDVERGRGLPIIFRCSDIFALNSAVGHGTAVMFGRYLPANSHVSVA